MLALPQRLLGWLFYRLYVRGGRYACYNQTPQLHRYPTALARSTGFDWLLFQVMISDRARVAAYRRDVVRAVEGRRVLEVGPGPIALMTRFAVNAGARQVISVEGNPRVARSAVRWLRKVRHSDDRVRVIAKFSDDLTAADVDGDQHFDVLLIECYHSIAAQERVAETIAILREHGFSFDSVISRGFVTYVAPAVAPPASPLTRPERIGLGWPGRGDRAAAAMQASASTVHGDHRLIDSLKLDQGQEWQRCDFEASGEVTTAGELSFAVTVREGFAGFLFWNALMFDDEILDTGRTSTGWGVFFLPTPVGPSGSRGSGPVVLRTTVPDPRKPSAVVLTAEVGGLRSEPVRL